LAARAGGLADVRQGKVEHHFPNPLVLYFNRPDIDEMSSIPIIQAEHFFPAQNLLGEGKTAPFMKCNPLT
jgi:hypothetical protein